MEAQDRLCAKIDDMLQVDVTGTSVFYVMVEGKRLYACRSLR